MSTRTKKPSRKSKPKSKLEKIAASGHKLNRSAAAKLGHQRRRERIAAQFAKRSAAAKLGHARRRQRLRKRQSAAKGTFRKAPAKRRRRTGLQGERVFTRSGFRHREYRAGKGDAEKIATRERKAGKRTLVYGTVTGDGPTGERTSRSTPVRLNEPGVGDLIEKDASKLKRQYKITRAEEKLLVSVLLEEKIEQKPKRKRKHKGKRKSKPAPVDVLDDLPF